MPATNDHPTEITIRRAVPADADTIAAFTTELARENLLDMVSSDYVPVSLLQAGFLLHHGEIGLSMPQAIAAVSLNPTRAAGLDDRGEIAHGKRADLLRVREVGEPRRAVDQREADRGQREQKAEPQPAEGAVEELVGEAGRCGVVGGADAEHRRHDAVP